MGAASRDTLRGVPAGDAGGGADAAGYVCPSNARGVGVAGGARRACAAAAGLYARCVGDEGGEAQILRCFKTRIFCYLRAVLAEGIRGIAQSG